SAAVDIAVVDSARGASEPGAARAELEARTPHGAVARVPPAVDEAPGAPAVEVRGVSAVYLPGQRPAVEGVDLVVPRRGHLALVGASGAGKTTVLRSEEHTSELQSRFDLVCRPLLEIKRTDAWRNRGLLRESSTTVAL